MRAGVAHVLPQETGPDIDPSMTMLVNLYFYDRAGQFSILRKDRGTNFGGFRSPFIFGLLSPSVKQLGYRRTSLGGGNAKDIQQVLT
jgi:hypothetical protein